MHQKIIGKKSKNFFVEGKAIAADIVLRELQSVYKQYMYYFPKRLQQTKHKTHWINGISKWEYFVRSEKSRANALCLFFLVQIYKESRDFKIFLVNFFVKNLRRTYVASFYIENSATTPIPSLPQKIWKLFNEIIFLIF